MTSTKPKHIIYKSTPDGKAVFIGCYLSAALAEQAAQHMAEQETQEADFISVSSYDPESLLYMAPARITSKATLDRELQRGLNATNRKTVIESLQKLAHKQGIAFIYGK